MWRQRVPFSLSEWFFTICLTPYNRKYNVLSASLNKTFPSFLFTVTNSYLVSLSTAGGIDTRIRGIKLTSTEERSLGFDRDFFSRANLVRYPILEGYSPDQLYRRSIVLQR